MVFVVLFLPVVVLSLVFLYKAGRITSEKMELQNAADAAAFSVAVVEARDLNYMAYTNRAMVANEVAIGQLVGLASWARHWRSFSDYIRAYNRLVLAPITFVHANMGLIGLKAFPAAVVGGFGSLPGAIVGGIVIGVVESLSGFYLPEGFKDIAAYIVVLVMLMVKPNGLFGEKLRKKV